MSTTAIARLFVLVATFATFFAYGIFHGTLLIAITFAVGIVLIVLAVEALIRRFDTKAIFSGIFGLFVGLVFANLFLTPLYIVHYEHTKLLALTLNVIFGYTGLVLGISRSQTLSLDRLVKALKSQADAVDAMLLDTSALIDARIADISATGLIKGRLIVANFVLNELQKLADSPDYVRRIKGKLGLETLQRIKNLKNLHLEVVDEDFSDIKEVDSKLIALAKKHHAVIITTDNNLNKVASVHGIQVLNINEIANALKPVVKQGDILSIFLSRPGKEPNQAVGYTDDGTMVVVEDGIHSIGSTVSVQVNSLMQGSAGRIIFAKLKDKQ